MVSAPDRVVVRKPEKCSCCGKKFTDRTKYQELSERRQVWDIPVPSMEVTEHRISGAKCCGMIHKGSFPPEAGAPVQYGNRILTLAGMPNVDFRMPYEKISQLTEDLYGVRMNKSTICRANERLFRNLEPIEKAIKKALLTSKVAHFDETGMRVEGSTHWFHTVSNERFCHLFVHKSRGREALQSADSLLPGFGGWAVHDCLSSYFNFTQTSHALCNAHILRELKGLAENGSNWAPVMSEFLMELYTATEKGTSVVNNPDEWNRRYDSICKQADNEEPPPVKSPRGKVKSSKGRNLFNRLSLHRSGVLAFANVPGVPFTNNPAEQDLRCVKIKQKVAMSSRTFTGAKIFARIQAAVKTFRKQGLNIFNSLLSVNLKQYLFFQGT
jgi:transposase